MEAHYHAKDLIFFVRQRSSDIEIIHEVVENDVYEVSFKPHDVIIDIGGHIGTFSVLASSYGTNVFTFEPVSENYKLLCDNVEINGFPVKTFNKAVSGKQETRTIFIRDFNYGGSNIYSGGEHFGKTEEVICTTLDDIFKDNNIAECNYLKLDCEGAELEILQAFTLGLSKIKKIGIECHSSTIREGLTKLLEKTHDLAISSKDARILIATLK